MLGPALPAIRCDDAELENARWFSRDWLMAVMAGVYIRTQAGSATTGSPCMCSNLTTCIRVLRHRLSNWNITVLWPAACYVEVHTVQMLCAPCHSMKLCAPCHSPAAPLPDHEAAVHSK